MKFKTVKHSNSSYPSSANNHQISLSYQMRVERLTMSKSQNFMSGTFDYIACYERTKRSISLFKMFCHLLLDARGASSAPCWRTELPKPDPEPRYHQRTHLELNIKTIIQSVCLNHLDSQSQKWPLCDRMPRIGVESTRRRDCD